MRRVVNVVPLRACDNVSRSLRTLADDIEGGRVAAQEALCVLRDGTDGVTVFGCGEYRGTIAALGLLEAAKAFVAAPPSLPEND